MIEDQLEPLELAVLEAILHGDDPVLVALRAQLVGLTVHSREQTGVGFFTNLVVSRPAAPAPAPSGRIHLGDVRATIPGLEHGAGFVLFVENGMLAVLEGYTFGEPWPERVHAFTLERSNAAAP